MAVKLWISVDGKQYSFTANDRIVAAFSQEDISKGSLSTYLEQGGELECRMFTTDSRELFHGRWYEGEEPIFSI